MILNVIAYIQVSMTFINITFIHILTAVHLVIIVTTGFIATVTNPEDRLVIEQKRCEENNLPFDDSNYEFYCNIC